MPDILTEHEAAEYLRVTVAEVVGLLEAGEIRARRMARAGASTVRLSRRGSRASSHTHPALDHSQNQAAHLSTRLPTLRPLVFSDPMLASSLQLPDIGHRRTWPSVSVPSKPRWQRAAQPTVNARPSRHCLPISKARRR